MRDLEAQGDLQYDAWVNIHLGEGFAASKQ